MPVVRAARPGRNRTSERRLQRRGDCVEQHLGVDRDHLQARRSRTVRNAPARRRAICQREPRRATGRREHDALDRSVVASDGTRVAPSAARTPISRARLPALPSSRPATFKHASSSTAAAAPTAPRAWIPRCRRSPASTAPRAVTRGCSATGNASRHAPPAFAQVLLHRAATRRRPDPSDDVEVVRVTRSRPIAREAPATATRHRPLHRACRSGRCRPRA